LTVRDLFEQFCGANKGEMDGKTFAKFAKDCDILNKKCTTTDIDLIFAKVKDKHARKIILAQFKAALELCASKRGDSMVTLDSHIIAYNSTVHKRTTAGPNKSHDENS